MKLIALIVMSGALCVAANAQTPSPTPSAPPKAAETPALAEKDLLNVRELQYQQAKRLLRRDDIEAELQQLEEGSKQFASALKTIVEAAAKAQQIDLTKWRFNYDTLKFESIPPAPAGGSNQKEKKP